MVSIYGPAPKGINVPEQTNGVDYFISEHRISGGSCEENLKHPEALIDEAIKRMNHYGSTMKDYRFFENKVNIVRVDDTTNKLVHAANSSLKELERKYKTTQAAPLKDRVEWIKMKILSVKLGGRITPEVLKQNPDFIKFITKTGWHNAAVVHNHVLPLINGKPGVIFEGREILFSDLKKEKHTDGDDVYDLQKDTLRGSCIMQDGVVRHWPYHPKELKVFKTEETDSWGNNQYLIEIMTSVKDKSEDTPVFSGDHCWVRLKKRSSTTDKVGEVYSWGVYGPMLAPLDYAKLRFKVDVNGCGDSPDRFENMDRNINNFHGTTVAVTEAEFNTLKESIEGIQKKGVPFSFLGITCQGHVLHQLKKIDVNIKATMTPAEFLGRKLINKKVRILYDKVTPVFIQKTFCYIADFFIGIPLRLGSLHASTERFKRIYGDEFNAYIPSFWNIFKPIQMQHPMKMRGWQRDVDTWRKDRTEELNGKIKALRCKESTHAGNAQELKSIRDQINRYEGLIRDVAFELPQKSNSR